MNNSIWEEYLENNYSKLDKDLDIDVLVIGGGMTGVNCCFQLMDKGLSICLVEKNLIGSGVTCRSTAKITYLQEDIYSKLLYSRSRRISKLYLDSQRESISIIKNIINKYNISCDFLESPSYLYALSDYGKKKLDKEKACLNSFYINCSVSDHLPDGTRCHSIYVNDTYTFNPIKYLNSLCKIINSSVSIYENSLVEDIKYSNGKYICRCNDHSIRCNYVVLGLHYPYFLFPFLIPFKTTLEKSYIKSNACTYINNFNGINLDKDIHSIRYYNNLKIELSGSHNICIKNNEVDNFKDFSGSKYYWSNKDIITNDYLPFIGRLNNNLFIGTGYNTWGMTNSIMSSIIIRDLILGNKNKYSELFDPKRGFSFYKFINTFSIISSNAYSFIHSKVNYNKKFYSKNISIITVNGKKVGVYIDKLDNRHYVYLKCPHIGCNLVFNEVEETWDCPCHGSRFNIDGKSIEGPSNYNISFK